MHSGPEFRQRRSGLLVPESVAMPSPMTQFQRFVTASDVMGEPYPLEFLQEMMESLGAWVILHNCASLLNELHDPYADHVAIETRIAKNVFEGEALGRAVAFAADGQVRLLAPQAVLLTAAMAIRAVPWERGRPSEFPDLGRVVALILHVAEASQALPESGDGLLAGLRSELALEIVANQNFNSPLALSGNVGRHERIWHELAPRLAQTTNIIDLKAQFEAALGVPMEAFEAVGFGLFAARGPGGYIVPRSWFDKTALDNDMVDKVLAATSRTRDQVWDDLTKALVDRVDQSRWRLDTFSQYPIVADGDADLIVVSPQLLIDRFFSGLAFFDAWAVPDGEQRAEVDRAWGDVTEAYGIEVLQSFTPGSGSSRRLWTEDDLRAAYGQGRSVVDAVIEYPEAWVVLDFSAHRLTRSVAQALSVEHLRKDINILAVEKARQAASTIDSLRAAESRLTGASHHLPRMFFPVVVTHGRWPTNFVTSTLVGEAVRNAGLLQESDVAPLQILTIEELEIVEGLHETGRPDFPTLLRNKINGPLSDMGFKDHVILLERIPVKASRRVERLFHDSARRMADTFGFPPDPAWGPGARDDA